MVSPGLVLSLDDFYLTKSERQALGVSGASTL